MSELAWAAGFFDGEGSTGCHSNNGNPYTSLRMSIGQKNDGDQIAETLLRFQKAVGVGKIYVKAHHSRESNQHQWFVSKHSDVLKCIGLLWPYLGTVKREQITLALKRYDDGQQQLNARIRERRDEEQRHNAA